MRSSIMMAVQDLAGEGYDAVLERVCSYGVDEITVAAAYHRARDVTPHGRHRVTIRNDGVHFRVDNAAFGVLQPPELPPLDTFTQLGRRLPARRLGLNGWGVFLHSTTLGQQCPQLSQENCFGDLAAPADLCPSQQQVREYAVCLGSAIAGLGVRNVFAESLHFGQFDHGYHHERSFVQLSAIDRFVLGICFCEACRCLAEERGVDTRCARIQARDTAEQALAGVPGPRRDVEAGLVAEHVGPDFAQYVQSRIETVTTLTEAVAAAVLDAGATLTFLDMTGAAKGYTSGEPGPRLAVKDSWLSGIDPAALGEIEGVTAIGVLAYARTAARIEADVRGYRQAVGSSTAIRALLRPSLPDTADAASLVRHVAAAKAAGADAVDFYHYGLCTFSDLDRITEAIADGQTSERAHDDI